MDKQYEILDHTADLKIRAFGNDLPGVFVNMASAIAYEQWRGQKSKVKSQNLLKEETNIESADLKSLFVDWLNEILYRSELNKKVYLDFEVKKFSETKIEAQMAGLKVEEKLIEIKAATYHDLEIKKVDDHWEAVVVFDI